MVVESIVCPECRAATGFTKVEPDTYYCSYHKGLFKYTAPGVLTVRHENNFCSCGNRVRFQCQPCHRVLCEECDIIERQKTLREENRRDRFGFEKLAEMAISVRGFGYLELVIPGAEIWSVAGGRIRKVPVPDGILGPFLRIGDVLPQISRNPDDLRHVCCECLSSGVTGAIDALADGRMCEFPGCGSAPYRRCRCCGSVYCPKHLADDTQIPIAVVVTDVDRRDSYPGPARSGLCDECADAKHREAARVIEQLAASHSGIWRDAAHYGDYRAQSAMPLRDKAIARRFGNAITLAVENIDRNPGPCSRTSDFDSNARLLTNLAHVRSLGLMSSRKPHYKIIDQRASVAPGPA